MLTNSPLQAILERLKGVKQTSDGYSALCPSHDDTNNSLSITLGDDGRVLLCCHAGCTNKAVCHALGLSLRDLFPPKAGSPQRRIAATYDYVDENGNMLFQKVRYEPKDFRCRVPDGSGGWNWKMGGVRRVLYRLPAVIESPFVFIAEGEKDCDLLAEKGYVATCNHDGAGKWNADYNRYFKDKIVYILPDNDDAGKHHAANIYRQIKEITKDCLIVELPGLPDKGDVSDFFASGGTVEQFLDAVAAAPEGLPESFRKDEQNMSLPRPVSTAYVPFCTEALPEPIQSYVHGGAAALGCEDSFVALPLLSALAGAIGNTRRIRLKASWSEPAVLWTGIIGESGTLKSPAVELALKPLRKIEAAAFEAFDEAMAAHQKELAAYEQKKMQRKKGMDPLQKPAEPVALRYTCSDVTIEALAMLLMQNSRGLLLVRDELAGWIRGFNSYKKTGGDESLWLELHGARTLLVDRKTGIPRTIYVPYAAVSVCGGIQPKILQDALGREHFENGLAARMLMAMPPRTTKRWNEHEIDLEVFGEVEEVFNGLLKMQMAIGANGTFAPRELPLTPEAMEAWIAFYEAHARQQTEQAGDLAAAFSKLEGYAARLALVIHCVRDAEGDPSLASERYVDADSVRRAVRIVRWFCDETQRIYAMFGENDEQAEERKLLEIIQRRGGRMTVRELMQASRAYRGGAAEAQFALDELVQLGWGYWQKEETGGRPCEVFCLYETQGNP